MIKPILLFPGFLFAFSVSQAKTICVLSGIKSGPLKTSSFELPMPGMKFLVVSKDGTTAQELTYSQVDDRNQLKAINGQLLVWFMVKGQDLSISLMRVNVSKKESFVLKSSVWGKADQPLLSAHYQEKIMVGCNHNMN
jgi:hypothetical protein